MAWMPSFTICMREACMSTYNENHTLFKQSPEAHKGKATCIANASVESSEDQYRINFFLPFIVNLISHLNSQFLEEKKEGNFLRQLPRTSSCKQYKSGNCLLI